MRGNYKKYFEENYWLNYLRNHINGDIGLRPHFDLDLPKKKSLIKQVRGYEFTELLPNFLTFILSWFMCYDCHN